MIKKVNVLISTYNGEKYIEQQIESIKQQSYKNIEIYVRDDGSKDRTIEILEHYDKKNEIKLLIGKNVGYGRSFLELLKIAEEGDYWAFCDQDDLWLPDKVKWAVEWLEQQDPELPLLFNNAYECVSENLKDILSIHLPPKYNFDFRRALTDCLYQGFAVTFNRQLRKLMLKGDITNISSHDWWANILVAKYGRSYFDDKIAVKHRRLNTSMSSMSMKNRINWLKKTFVSGNSDIKSCAKAYTFIFDYDITDKDFKIAKWFAHDSYCLKDSIKKAFYPKRWRAQLSSEIVVRVLMLMGKI